VDYRLKNPGVDCRTGSLPSNGGTLLALVIIITKSLSGDVRIVKKGKGETRMIDNQGPSTEEARQKRGCNLHSLGMKGVLLGVEIGLVGKEIIRGKTGGNIRGKTRVKI